MLTRLALIVLLILLTPYVIAEEKTCSQWGESNRVDEYRIDKLFIKAYVSRGNCACTTPNQATLIVSGIISMDSSYAISKIIQGLNLCPLPSDPGPGDRLRVTLDSPGGEIIHGLYLGELLRNYGALTIVPNGKTCASSCALAFLGGSHRHFEYGAKLALHAPYTVGEDGKITCHSSGKVADGLKQYLLEMLGPDYAEIVFDRMMSYCSRQEAWTITGTKAAHLYGIVSEPGWW
ncbi:hypothetical protein [Pseudohaliea sp.]|uniref:hypothetical protein n=1 Tax=Pseudohaliea sp. TaxID=2740289 RepID=UPI0032EE3362